VVVGTPPADRAEILAVATERLRRRSTLRAVVLTAPEDVAGRLAALEQGYDDALPATIDASELAVRLRRLSAGTQRSAGRTAIPICDSVELDGFDSPG
jgi:DNA-binding response OmpR family regulator